MEGGIAEPAPTHEAAQLLRLRLWQWVFGVLAPVALIAADLAMFGGVLVAVAPASLWTLALVGPALLVLSQWRWRGPLADALNGALAVSGILALLIMLAPSFLMLTRGAPPEVAAVFALSSMLFLWPLIFCSNAFRRQLQLRLRRRTSLVRGSPLAGAASLLLAIIGIEATDRALFISLTAQAASPIHDTANKGLEGPAHYPLGLMARYESACGMFYGVPLGSSFVDADDLQAGIHLRHGPAAPSITEAAARVFGVRPAIACANALRGHESERDWDCEFQDVLDTGLHHCATVAG